jgi:hypothetical protein
MSTLPAQQYSNISRTVSGTPLISPSDEILLCDTSIDVVTINLLDIPAGAWNSIYKLYVIDASNNAATKNITINAPSGYTINGSANVVINTNGGSALVRIVSDTKYLAQLNIASGVGAQGTQGIQGIQGTSGIFIFQGLQGTQGIQGLQGLSGQQGTQGLQGLLGFQGLQGLIGNQGIQGSVGAGGVIGYYGTFYDFSTQTISVALTPKAVEFSQTYINNGISIASSSQITFANPGTYLVVCNIQAYDSAGGGGVNLYTFFKKGGVNVSTSLMTQALDGYPALIERQIEVNITSADILGGTNYVQLFWTSDNTSAIIYASGTPGSPYNGPVGGSTWASVSQVTYSVQGTQGLQGSLGIQGLQGIQGSGTVGSQGTQGIQGTIGLQGIQGTQGVQGNNGSQGLLGSQGIQGLQGIVGQTGAGGAIGYWGSFWSTQDQTGNTTTPQNITYNNTDPNSNGVSIVSTSRITFAYSGVYSITFSVQFSNSNNSIETADIWLLKNGSAVTDTNTKFDVIAQKGTVNGFIVGTVNYVLQLNAGDYLQLNWLVTNTSVLLEYDPATASHPATPSIILTATQVAYALQGTQGIQGRQGLQGGGFNQAQGTQGTQGLIGVTGSQGTQGLQGTIGSQGIQGRQGTQGTQGISNQGIQGIQGRQGTQGLQGGGFNQAQGTQGTQGISNQGVQGRIGFQGIQGPAGGGAGTAWLLGGNTGITPTDTFGSNTGAIINFVTDGNTWGQWYSDYNVVSFGNGSYTGTTSSYIVALGNNAGRSSSNTEIVAIGSSALRDNAGQDAIGIGYFAGYQNTGARYAISIGREAGYQNSGTGVILIGFGAGYTNARDNAIAIGLDAGYANGGNNFIGIGANAGNGNTAGDDLVCFGHESGRSSSGTDVLALGNNALNGNSGDSVVGIGKDAGYNIAGPVSNSLSNQFIVSQQYIPQYPDYATAQANINVPGGGAPGNFYFFYNTTTLSIDAVLL